MSKAPMDSSSSSGNQAPSIEIEKNALSRLFGAKDMHFSLKLLAPVILLSLLFDVLIYSSGMPVQGLWVVLVGLSAVALLIMWLLGRHSLIRRNRLFLWRFLIVSFLSVQAAGWAIIVAQGLQVLGAVIILLGVSGIVLSLIPLVHWIPGLILVLLSSLLVSLWQAGNETVMVMALSIHLPLLFLGLAILLLAGRVRQTEIKARQLAGELVLSQSRFSDQQARINHEQEQREDVEQDLLAVRELADSAGRAKTEFLATISHEIRTPLNGILPTLEMLQASSLNDDQKRYVRTATSSSRHLLRIINDILDFSKAESGKLQLESIEIELRELIGSVVDLMQSSARSRGLSLKVEIADDVPLFVRGDPIRLRQIITNLVSNAIKFTEAGGVKISVRKNRSSRKEIELVFAVSDTGKGILQETSEQLFKSFSQADASTTRKYGGTGLGLVICKRLVTLMGGKIGVRSRVGEGSTFWFMLPMRKSVMDVPSARQSLSGVRILTAIKDQETADYVSTLLAKWGVVEERVSSLGEAVTMLQSSATLGKSWSYDLFLIDAWGVERQIPIVLRDLRTHAELKNISVLIASRSVEQSQSLKNEFSVYTLTGMLKSGPLRRCLDRLLDVEGNLGHYEEGEVDDPSSEYQDLNINREQALNEEPVEHEPRAWLESIRFSGCVLLVEDNPVNLGVVKKILTHMGVECLEAHNGQEALAVLQEKTVELVFMDCQMPLMDGYQATINWREIERREHRDPLPVIAMTANAMQGDRDRCLQAGMTDYLAKPVSIQEIEGVLRQWLQTEGQWETDTRAQSVHSEKGSNAVLDSRIVNELREVLDDEFPDLVRLYLGNSPDLLEQLQHAFGQCDLSAIVMPAHSLKSSSANLGAMLVSEIAGDIEVAAKGGRMQDALGSHQRLAAAYAAAKEALEAAI